jgi:hypothetical protein
MSYINDYAVKILADQRQHDFQVEAANERLARIARNGHQVWWRRLLSGTKAPVAASTVTRPTRQTRPTLHQHPVAH